MPRSFKSLFVELVSFLTLFALIGTMTSNFWERYLIQSELSNMKSSLHLLKETVHHIGVAYDDLHYELKGLADGKKIEPTNIIPKEAPYAHRSSEVFNTFTNMLQREIIKIKSEKGAGNTAPQGYDKGIGSAELRGNDKSMGTPSYKENDQNLGFFACKGTNYHAPPQQGNKFSMKTDATTATRNSLKSTGANSGRSPTEIKPAHDPQENCNSNNMHRCCKDHNCYEYQYVCKF